LNIFFPSVAVSEEKLLFPHINYVSLTPQPGIGSGVFKARNKTLTPAIMINVEMIMKRFI